MGNQLGAAQQPDYNNLPELQALSFVERLGGGRFLKTLKCAIAPGGGGAGAVSGENGPGGAVGSGGGPHPGGCQLLTVKVYVKRGPAERLGPYEEMLAEVRQLFEKWRLPSISAAARGPARAAWRPFLSTPPNRASSAVGGSARAAPERGLSSFNRQVRARLSVGAAPNVMPFHWFKETAHVAYLARQYLHSTLLERMTTPPFITLYEKR